VREDGVRELVPTSRERDCRIVAQLSPQAWGKLVKSTFLTEKPNVKSFAKASLGPIARERKRKLRDVNFLQDGAIFLPEGREMRSASRTAALNAVALKA